MPRSDQKCTYICTFALSNDNNDGFLTPEHLPNHFVCCSDRAQLVGFDETCVFRFCSIPLDSNQPWLVWFQSRAWQATMHIHTGHQSAHSIQTRLPIIARVQKYKYKNINLKCRLYFKCGPRVNKNVANLAMDGKAICRFCGSVLEVALRPNRSQGLWKPPRRRQPPNRAAAREAHCYNIVT
jgi:hypothetical protein